MRRSTRTAAIMGEFIREVVARASARNGARFLNIGRERRRTRTAGRGVRRTCRRKASCDSLVAGIRRYSYGWTCVRPSIVIGHHTGTRLPLLPVRNDPAGLIKGFTFATSHAFASSLRAVDRDTRRSIREAPVDVFEDARRKSLVRCVGEIRRLLGLAG